MANFTPVSLFLLFLVYSTNLPLINSTTSTFPSPKPKRLSIDLLHSNLVLPKNTTLGYNKYGDDVQVDLIPNLPLVMVNFTIGNPPIPQLALFDTGSKVIWVAERNCEGCVKKTVPLYDPKKSKSYKEIPCYEHACHMLSGFVCYTSKSCTYTASYASEGIIAKGVLAKDEFSFTTVDDGVRLVPDSTFASCNITKEIEGLDNRAYNGIFGLGLFFGALVYELGAQFSYCISDLSDPKHSYSRLHFGDDDISSSGVAADLEINMGGIYRISLERVYVGEEFMGGISRHYLILDTGTAITWWAKNYLTVIKEKLRSVMLEMGRRENYDYEGKLCYWGDIDEDLLELPEVLLEFDHGAYMSLTPHNLFMQQTPRVYCLLMRKSHIPNSSILGLMAQQNHYFTYDLSRVKLHIQSISCAGFDE